METNKATFFALLAAALYALSTPLSKPLLTAISPAILAGLLYLGAGMGIAVVMLLQYAVHLPCTQPSLEQADFGYLVAMVCFDTIAPIFLMLGRARTTAENVALLNNFEIVATSVLAFLFFREKISSQLWAAIALITTASLLLSFENIRSFSFSLGSLYVLLACLCWGMENNCTKRLSEKNPLQIVMVKGLGSGPLALSLGLLQGQKLPRLNDVLMAFLLGFLAVGLSVYFYVLAQRTLGAAKTSAYYASSPFIATLLSLLIFRKLPNPFFGIALSVMAAGVWLTLREPTK